MSDEIKPALTPEEWAGGGIDGPYPQFDGACLPLHGSERVRMTRFPSGVQIQMGPDQGSAFVDINFCHALAALCLHNPNERPADARWAFGFTWEDVSLLYGRVLADEGLGVVSDQTEQLADLARRIAFLIPPLP